MRSLPLFRPEVDFLTPRIYPSNGLMQAHFDGLGGAPIEDNASGTIDGMVFTVIDNRFEIPLAQFGSRITWVRGIWLSDVTFRYNGFMSDLTPTQTLPGARNYLATIQTELNVWLYGNRVKIDPTIVDGVITNVAIVEPGKYYTVGTIVPINGGNNDARFTVASVDANGGILTISNLVGGTGYITRPSYTTMPVFNTLNKTVVTVPVPIPDGTQVQMYFSYRTYRKTKKGQALGGYPNRHISQDDGSYGSANDGDNYMAAAYYYAYSLTGSQQYKLIADRLLAAQIHAGYGLGQFVSFDLPIDSLTGSAGLYFFNGGGAGWNWDLAPVPGGFDVKGLRVQTEILEGGPPYGFAGWGTWPAWPVTPTSPFHSYEFDFWGNGLGGLIQLSTNIYQPAIPAGEFVYGFACLPKDANTKRHFSVAKADFWGTSNLILNGDRTNSYKGAASSDESATVVRVEDDQLGPSGFHQFYTYLCTVSATSTYAVFYFGSNAENWSSAGYDRVKMDIDSAYVGTMDISVKTDLGDSFEFTTSVVLGPQVIEVLFNQFTPSAAGLTTLKQINLQPAGNSLSFKVNNIRFATATADIVTMENTEQNIKLLGGFQFGFGAGVFDVYWKNLFINQTETNPYPGITRYTYGFIKYGNYYGKSSWQGQIAVGYLWMMPYTLSGIRFPANTIAKYSNGDTYDYSGLPVVVCMRKFMKDAQDAYHSQFPAQLKGPMMSNYGAWAWEFVKAYGNVGGQIVPNATYPEGILNQFYFAADGSIGPTLSGTWRGYQCRALLSCAEDYFISGDSVSLEVTQNWLNFIDALGTWNEAQHKASIPANFGGDGTVTNGRAIYFHVCTAQAFLYKYWRDGDPVALKWVDRIVQDIHYNFKYTQTGKVEGIFPEAEGTGYTWADVAISDPTGTGAVIVPYVAGGGVTHYNIINAGNNYTDPQIVITGDGTGAKGNIYLTDKLFGGYDNEHTGWEVSEVGKMLGMIVNGRASIGPMNFRYVPTVDTHQDFLDLMTYYNNNTGDKRPSILQSDLLPMHEYTWSSFHWRRNIDDPVTNDGEQGGSRDTHTDGDIWTETIGPSIYFATDVMKHTKNNDWLQAMYQLTVAMFDQPPLPVIPGSSNVLSPFFDGSDVDLNTNNIDYDLNGGAGIPIVDISIGPSQ